MCRLFLAINLKTYDTIDTFINTGTLGTEKQNDPCLDGYGLVWGKSKKNHSFCKPYYQDNQYDKTLQKIKDSKPNIVWGHIRQKTDTRINSLPNNQPFIYKNDNVVFMHNGEIKDFLNHKTFLLSNIDAKYKPEIKGTTDSELIMFLYLTIIDKYTHEKQYALDKIMRKSMNELYHFFEINNISVIANIICTIKDTIAISRYVIHPWKINYPFLYIEENNTSLLVSTQRLARKQFIIPKDTILIRTIDN